MGSTNGTIDRFVSFGSIGHGSCPVESFRLLYGWFVERIGLPASPTARLCPVPMTPDQSQGRAVPAPGVAACINKAVSTAQKLHEFARRVKCSLVGRISGVFLLPCSIRQQVFGPMSLPRSISRSHGAFYVCCAAGIKNKTFARRNPTGVPRCCMKRKR